MPPRGQDGRAESGGRFGRMFCDAARPDPGDDAVEELVRLIEKRSATHGPNDTIPAGFTYLGQFVDHDITFDPTSKLDGDNDPLALVNFRTPRFDLDSVYGSGPDDQPFLYEWTNRDDRGVKLLVGGDAALADLPRNAQGLALIGDARNDENLIVSQLHLLFIRFHNAVADHIRDTQRLQGAALFERARQVVRWHYQWIVTHDFLRRVAGPLAGEVLRDGDSPSAPASVHLRHFNWEDEPFIPIEFSGAAYRFGHSMVRPKYRLMRGAPVVAIFPPAGAESGDGDLGGFRPLTRPLALHWDLFFWEKPIEHTTNSSLRINNRVALELFAVPDRGVLPRLNLQRGRALDLPSGPAVAAAMGARQLDARELQLEPLADDGLHEILLNQTPLWYYVLCEAGTNEFGRGGEHLGPVGGRIVAEVLVGLLQGDPESYLSCDPAWRPTLPAARACDFTMIDLVRFVRDAEA
ncbi:MAG: heme peroxidase family protein [Solirubrobacteraceae bacterium]|nr:heme peroxidase family protein [Solirubrobacteraceae bacterium]